MSQFMTPMDSGDLPPRRRLQPASKFILGLLGDGLIFFLLVCVIAALAQRLVPAVPTAARQPFVPKVSNPDGLALPDRPDWPEVPFIRRWFRRKALDFSSLVFITWHRQQERHGPPQYNERHVFTGYAGAPLTDYVRISVTYQGQNKNGAWTEEEVHFLFADGLPQHILPHK